MDNRGEQNRRKIIEDEEKNDCHLEASEGLLNEKREGLVLWSLRAGLESMG